jgi:hypothetical protein
VVKCDKRLPLIGVLAGLACSTGEARPAPTALVVQPSGCAVLRQGACELAPNRRLRLWVDGEPAPLRARTDRGSLPLGAGAAADSGRRYDVTVPAGAGWIEIDRETGTSGRRPWRLALLSTHRAPVLEQAAKLGGQGREAEAETLLRQALPGLSDDDQGRGEALLGRLALQRGDLPAAITGLGQARQAARRSGRVSDWLVDTETLVFVHTFGQHDLARAQGLIDEVSVAMASPALDSTTSRARLAAMTARLAEEAGDLRGALAAMRTAENLDRRMGETRFARYERGEIARLLATVGRAGEALPIVQELVEHEATGSDPEAACNVAASRHNLAWVSAMTGQRSAADQATRLFAAAHVAYRDCPNPHLYQHLLIDEALFALDTENLARARACLDQLRTLVAGGAAATVVTWLGQIEGRLALASGRPRQAARAFAATIDRARAASLIERELEARSGRGQALAAMGQRAAAVGELTGAEQILDRLFTTVPLGEGRDLFLASRGQSARLLVETLVELDRPAEALAAARRARGRLLRATAFAERVASLGAADRARWLAAIGSYRLARARMEEVAASDWKLSAQALAAALEQRSELAAGQNAALDQAYQVLAGGSASRPDVRPASGSGLEPQLGPDPGPGQALVLWFPARRGWLVFVARASGLTVRRIETPSDRDAGIQAVARRSLEAIAADLEGVDRVRLLPQGQLGGVDFHALPVGDRPLGERFVVEYGLDLGQAASVSGTKTTGRRGRAVLLGNPTGDLPAAETELKIVSQRLRGWDQDIPAADRATPDHLLGLLPAAALFHYAGHGTRAGVEGLGSHLRLANERQLRATDILALDGAPRLVVLSACDAARTAADQGDTLGFGQAFLLAGARAVVAPTRPLGDQTALAIVTEFYGKTANDPAFDPGRALQAAQMAVRRRDPSSDWASFRVLVP